MRSYKSSDGNWYEVNEKNVLAATKDMLTNCKRFEARELLRDLMSDEPEIPAIYAYCYGLILYKTGFPEAAYFWLKASNHPDAKILLDHLERKYLWLKVKPYVAPKEPDEDWQEFLDQEDARENPPKLLVL
jgi:hypothetical protein